ncbi:NACHT domain-containing protein [Mycobacteroides abscessus]|nr:hypothetical protein [Mycobacteroides abscessus]MBN7498160.1 hypothetical protein [Mycobacteroides abscessus subsp. abscessus]MBN7532345.1 hypothetical protein [Mycobacteroides abscessus subsp. abscessus]MBN7546725.1 hypothetical protein [Mycobacteroides abscessus subsp. abscessus]MBN7570447.1 hypothetical protein [Mycobacteroides abscessus subsp. abscessus]MDB2197149.1 hypothetical protein [Mycobacteroides abscessus subsp. abscessus]
MENDFSYEQLSPRSFEQLSVAVAESVIGAGIEVYGPGPDGGREATWSGTINWSNTDTDDKDRWQGYTVIQVKHCSNPTQIPDRDLAWLTNEIAKELKSWMNPETKRTQFPAYLLIITNIKLTPADPGGTMQRLNIYIDSQLDHKYGIGKQAKTLRDRGLREIKVWHRNKLNSLLTNNSSIRQRFTPLISVGDIIERLQHLPGSIPVNKLAQVFVDHAQSALQTSRWIRFDDAGDDDSRHQIDRIVVNLPVDKQDGTRSTALSECVERSERLLRLSLCHAERSGAEPPPRHLVITGAPGNGKSTLTRYLAHAYRADFVSNEKNPTSSSSSIINETMTSFDRLGLIRPTIHRWPLRIELAHMAEAMGPTPDSGPSIQKYLCDLISQRSAVQIHPDTLNTWLATWPCVLLFDGLDEVTHRSLRERVINEITQLVASSDDSDCDLFIIVTTRPTGYTERLLPKHFDQLDLAYFTHDEANVYGQFVTSQRLAADEPEYRQSILNKFTKAVNSPGVQRLLKTPLQVLILTVIVASTGQLPTNRYRLFWTYFDTVFKREANKNTTQQTFLNTYRTEIEDIHLRVGLALHQRCETTQEIRARLPLAELRDIAYERIREDGHQIPQANELADKLVDVATRRLVLLVADEDQTVSFDVRSLQELMAGRALIARSEADHRHNLTIAARSPHWRNAWLFAAGEMFAGGSYDREIVVKVVEDCDAHGPWPGWLYPVGPELAAEILDDGLAANKPVFLQRLLTVALRCLDGPMPTEPKSLARGLTSAATDSQLRSTLRDALAQGLAGTPVQRAIASALIHYGDFGGYIPGEPQNPQRYADMWVYRGPKSQGSPIRLGSLIRNELERYAGKDAISEQLSAALTDCDTLRLQYNELGEMKPLSSSGSKEFDSPSTYAALSDTDDSELLQIALSELSPDDWPAKSLLARACWPALSRVPISGDLRI